VYNFCFACTLSSRIHVVATRPQNRRRDQNLSTRSIPCPQLSMLLFTVLLRILHLVYSVILRLQHLWRQWSSLEPLPLQTPRQRIPHHLAILFVVDPTSDPENTKNALTESALRVVSWSRTIGVKKLTLYEENGQFSSVPGPPSHRRGHRLPVTLCR
jgi:hypothetical protein